MALYKETGLGKITVDNKLFAGLIEEALQSEECLDLIWLSSRKGKLIATGDGENFSEIASAIEIDGNPEESSIDMTIPVIIKFGTSISRITDKFCDILSEKMKAKSAAFPRTIKRIVTGVKSRNIAKRNLEIIKEYESR